MDLEDMRLGCSPITGRIYLYKPSKKDKDLADKQVDITKNFHDVATLAGYVKSKKPAKKEGVPAETPLDIRTVKEMYMLDHVVRGSDSRETLAPDTETLKTMTTFDLAKMRQALLKALPGDKVHLDAVDAEIKARSKGGRWDGKS